MKKKSLRIQYALALVGASIGLSNLMIPSTAADTTPLPEVVQVFAETSENGAIEGDSIIVVYNQPMLIEANPHPLAGGMQDINNIPGSELEAPAEYPHHQGNVTGKKTARNYHVKITPGTYSLTPAFEGTWEELGGQAFYHPSDPYKRTVLLKPPNKQAAFFAPGDHIELTVAMSVKNPKGKAMKANKNKKRGTSS